MMTYEELLRQVSREVQPFSYEEATVVVAVYHPDSMDQPAMAKHTFTQAQLAESSNLSITESVMTAMESMLMEVLGKWRGS